MIRLDEFMQRAAADYYARCDPFADFTTAPEIAQMFGELLGAWAATCWELMGRPKPVLLAEAGPGRGTLMQDALRATQTVAKPFNAALQLHLIETSPRLRAIQAVRLPGAHWHDRLEQLPDGPMLLIGNEFLDALPIRQFVRRCAGWAERHVDQGAFVEHPSAPPPGLAAVPGIADGMVVEHGEAALTWIERLAARLARQGGAALLLDYGPARSGPGDSLQALRQGRPADPLAAPGSADLTAHVDFARLAAAARAQGALVHGPVLQGTLLQRLGLFVRTERLARALPATQARSLLAAAQRLAAPARMGTLFKAMAICHPALPPPPGFEP